MNTDAVAFGLPSAAPEESTLERRFFAALALLLLLTALVGFVPSSLDKINAVRVGQRPPFPWILHVHAVLMGSWMVLLVLQSLLVARGRVDLHRRLGTLAFWHVPLLTVFMVLMTRYGWQSVLQISAGAMPPEALAGVKAFVANLLIAQLQSIVLFPTLVGCALAVRRRDPATHKRLLIIATMLPLMAGIDRATARWGVSTVPQSSDSLYVWTLALFLPILMFDLLRYRRPHRATLAGLGVLLACFAITHWLWGTPAWQAAAPAIMRIAGISGW